MVRRQAKTESLKSPKSCKRLHTCSQATLGRSAGSGNALEPKCCCDWSAGGGTSSSDNGSKTAISNSTTCDSDD